MSVKFPHKKEKEIKSAWPKGYKRFKGVSKKESFAVKPQKYNYKLILLSLIVAIIVWFWVISPYLNQPIPVKGPIKVKIFQGKIPEYSNPKPK